MPDKSCGERNNGRPGKTREEAEPNVMFDLALFGFPARGHNLQFCRRVRITDKRLSQGKGEVPSLLQDTEASSDKSGMPTLNPHVRARQPIIEV